MTLLEYLKSTAVGVVLWGFVFIFCWAVWQ